MHLRLKLRRQFRVIRPLWNFQRDRHLETPEAYFPSYLPEYMGHQWDRNSLMLSAFIYLPVVIFNCNKCIYIGLIHFTPFKEQQCVLRQVVVYPGIIRLLVGLYTGVGIYDVMGWGELPDLWGFMISEMRKLLLFRRFNRYLCCNIS